MIRTTTLILILTYFSTALCAEDYEKLAGKITNVHQMWMKRNFNMCCVGGGGAMMDKIKKVGLFYVSYREYSIDDARKIFVQSAEQLINLFNNSKLIRPHLSTYPFTHANLGSYILAFDFSEANRDKAKVNGAMICDGNIVYTRGYPGGIDTVYEEPYEEAKAICIERGYLKEQRPPSTQTLPSS